MARLACVHELRTAVGEQLARVRRGRVGGRVELAYVQARDARRLAALGGHGPRLHLGCGLHTMAGWVNIDHWTTPSYAPRGDGSVVINHDLRRGLPLADNSCSEIYSSHLLEHFPATEGARLLSDCHRALMPSGRLRTCVPDFTRLARAYLEHDREYFAPLYNIFVGRMGDGMRGSGTIMDAMNNALYQFGEHQCMYDMEKLEALLSAIGFSVVHPSSFDPTIDGDWDAREHFSLYIDAVK